MKLHTKKFNIQTEKKTKRKQAMPRKSGEKKETPRIAGEKKENPQKKPRCK